MKIILFGKNGQVGSEFLKILPILGDVIPLGHNEVDVSDPDALQKILKELKPGLIINASAYTEVDRAENEFDLAMKVNAVAPGVMAEVARNINAVFIHYSTDYVFDGKKDQPYTEIDPVNPLNAYGKSKLAGEENIKQAGDAYIILRTSWVYSLQGESFVNKVLRWARKNETLRIVTDQISNPTWARTLAGITYRMLANNQTDMLEIIRERHGVYHLAGNGYISRYEWAKQIIASDPDRIEQIVRNIVPALSGEFPTPAVRPLFSALNCTCFEKTFGLQLPDWRSTLELAMSA